MAIIVWSLVVIAMSVGTGRLYVGGVEEYSTVQILWGPLLAGIGAAGAAFVALRACQHGNVRRARGWFVVTAVLGVVGLVGLVISVVAIVRTRQG